MSEERWSQIQELFAMAVDLPAEKKQAALQERSGDDPLLVADVLKLLEADASEYPLIDDGLEDAAAAMLEFEPLTSLIRKRAGPYRLLEILGEGGVGVVYLAERTDIGSLVAIKLLRDAWLSPSRRERFRTEQRILAQLNHPSIARIYDSGSLDDGTPWFVMEYVAGVPLTDFWSERRGAISRCLRLFRKVCEAVQYAHEHAIIHRDLKPSNILVKEDEEIKLLDFGIAKQTSTDADDGNTTAASLSMMTPNYCAPEQLMGGSVGVYTDVYALGVMLYQMLAGRLPFTDPPDAISAQRRTLEEVPDRPSALARINPSRNWLVATVTKAEWADLDAICLRALKRQPVERYRSVDAMIRDIDAYLNGEPLEARPEGLGYKLGKFIRRNKFRLAFAAALLLIATSAGVFFTVRLARARNTALAEAARTERIKRFMLNLFGDADPEAAPSNDLKALTLLDRGTAQAASLEADAATQAALYETLGSMYNRLGKYDKSYELLNIALSKMKQATGPESPNVADVMVQIGVVRGDQGKVEEGAQIIEQASKLVQANHLAPTDPIAMETAVAMGRLAVQRGNYQKAEDILKPIAALPLPHTEDQSYHVRDSLAALVNAELGLQQLADARATGQRAVALDRQLLGASHPQTAVDLLNLASVTASLGELPEAEKAYREGIAILSEWYGKDNPDVITAKSILAKALAAEKKTDEAELLLKEVLQSQEKSYGPVHERVAFTLNALGEIALSRGDLPTAEADFLRASTIDEKLLGEKNAYTAVYKSNLGIVYVKESKYVLAESTLRSAVDSLATLPPGNRLIGIARGRWGKALLALGRYPEAEEQLTAAYQLLKALPHAPSLEVRNVSEDLVKLYEATHRADKARSLNAELSANGQVHSHAQ
jgi:eukaryotic-like serine/threonine-protein kinase